MRLRAVFLVVLSVACGKVEKKDGGDAGTDDAGPRDAGNSVDEVCAEYCDHALTCDDTLDEIDCLFFCHCMFESVRPDVAPDFIRCQAAAPCGSDTAQQGCGMTWGSTVEPTPAAQNYIEQCNGHVDAIGGCDPIVFDCNAARLIRDDLLKSAGPCLTEPTDCPSMADCVFGSFFQSCLGPPGG